MTAAPVQPPLSASGRYIVDADGRRVRLAGVNWYGAHEDDGVVSGLERTGRVRLARAIARLGFNSVRLPFSLWMTEQATPVPDEYLAANPDLSGATPMQVYDACVEALTGAGLVVIPNCHTLDAGWCCADDDEQGLWFNDRWPAGRFFAAWQQLAARYRSNPLVAGMDIMNEPRRSRVGRRILTPAWGSGRTTDMAAMYTAAGNLIHEVSPDVLIICEGLGFAADLAGVARHPVRLERPGKVVYSLHDYSWFHPREQPRAAYSRADAPGWRLPAQRAIAPLWIGEFGIDTRSVDIRPPILRGVVEQLRSLAHRARRGLVLVGAERHAAPGTVPVDGQHRSRWGDPNRSACSPRTGAAWRIRRSWTSSRR